MSDLSQHVATLISGKHVVRIDPTAAELTARAYRYWRQKGYRAFSALAKARDDQAAIPPVSRWPEYQGTCIGAPSRDGLSWIENPAAVGLRFVKWCDQVLTRCRHTGYYTDSDGCNGTLNRGAVWQFPGRDGRAIYVAGYRAGNTNRHGQWSDACGSKGKPGAIAYLDLIIGDKLESSYDDDSALRDAAIAADRFAERSAEREREYNDAWQAGAKYSDKRDNIKSYRSRAKELIREIRTLRLSGATASPVICDALRDRARQYVDLWRDEREALAKHISDNGGLSYAWQAHLLGAFCDGAGLSIGEGRELFA